MSHKRYFRLPGDKPISAVIDYAVFAFINWPDGSMRMHECWTEYQGKRRNKVMPWSWRDAQSLLESGHWIEVTNPHLPDIPAGGETLEGGAW